MASMQRVVQSATTYGQAMIAQLPAGVSIAKVQRVMQQFADPAREADGAARGGFEQFMAAPQEMPKTLLMVGVEKVVVRRPAVVNHQAGVIEAEHALGRFAGARRIDDIGGRVFANQAMQP